MRRAAYLILIFSAIFAGVTPAADVPEAVTKAHRSVVRVILSSRQPTRSLFPLLNQRRVVSLRGGKLRDEGILDLDQVLRVGAAPLYNTVETQGVVLDDGETIVIPDSDFPSLNITPKVGQLNFNVAIVSGTGELLKSSGGPFPIASPASFEVVWDRHLLLQEGPANAAFLGYPPAERAISMISSPILLRVKGGLGLPGVKAKPVNGEIYYRGQRGGLRRAYALSLSYSPSGSEPLTFLDPVPMYVTEEESLIDEVIDIIPRRPGQLDVVAQSRLYAVWDRYISNRREIPQGSAIVDESGTLLMVTLTDHLREPRSFNESATGFGVCGGWVALMARHQVSFLKPSITD